LLTMRGTLLAEAGRTGEARAVLEKAISQEPRLVKAYWARIQLALQEKNHDDTITWLKRIVVSFDAAITVERMKMSAEYAAFVASPQFTEFREWYKARKK